MHQKTLSDVSAKGDFDKVFYNSQDKMGKSIVKMQQQSTEVVMSKVKKALGDQCACFVLITCSHPGADGKMQVEMNFDGEESLAAFLVDNASQVFDDRIAQQESK